MFNSTRLKIARADAHIDECRSILSEFEAKIPHFIRGDGRYHMVSYDVYFDEPVPESLSICAGDAIHNLRSALDHLFWEITIADGAATSRNTQFPITRGGQSDFATMVSGSGLRSDAQAELHRIEAFSGGQGEWIVDLHRLDIIDKHQQLPVVLEECVVSGILEQGQPDQPVVERPPMTLTITHVGTTVMRNYRGMAGIGVGAREPHEFPKLDCSAARAAPIIKLGGSPFPGLDVISTLARCRDGIVSIVDQFEEMVQRRP